jgi:DNA-binding beta-propeller fold protein YncE
LITDYSGHLIRHILLSTASVTTLAGVAGSVGATNGMGTNAYFRNPEGISISPDGVFALVADRSNNIIRHIVISTAYVTTLAGGSVSGSTNGVSRDARFNNPTWVSYSRDGSFALVADYGNHLIREIIVSTASVSTLAGSSVGSTNGVGTNAKFNSPEGICISPDGSFALVGEVSNNLVRRISGLTISSSPSATPTT